jgi:hypothetical protein
MALQDHPQRIADEEHLNACRTQFMCKSGVITGKHGDFYQGSIINKIMIRRNQLAQDFYIFDDSVKDIVQFSSLRNI